MKIYLVYQISCQGMQVRCVCNSEQKAKKIVDSFPELALEVKEMRVI